MDVPKTLDCASVEEQDLVSRYIGEKLSSEEAEAFEEHYFGCDRCWQEVKAGTEVRAALGAPATRAMMAPAATRIRWPYFALAAAIAAAVFSAGLLISRGAGRVDVADLAKATSELPYSRLQARLGGPFETLPPDRAMRGGEPTNDVDLKAAALRAQQQARDHPSPSSLHAAGVGHLLLGELDQAIETLEAARKENAAEPAIWTDLSAAYIARAQSLLAEGQADAAVRDYDAALGAIQNSPDAENPSRAALFNRALVLEARKLDEEAIEAWKKYRAVETDARWREEADRHLARLTRPTSSEMWRQEKGILDWHGAIRNEGAVRETVRRFPQQSRFLVQDVLLPAWGQAFLDSRESEADAALDLARLIGRVRAEAFADFLIADSVAVIDDASRHGEAARLEDLARGHVEYGAGREAEAALSTSNAISRFETARDRLGRAASPFQWQAVLGIGRAGFYSRIRETLGSAEEVIASTGAGASRYPSLLAHANWQRGFALGQTGYPNEAIEAHRSAVALFERLSETENAAAIHGLLSEDLGYLGDLDGSWARLDRALELLNGVGNVPRRALWIAAAARAYAAENRTGLALAAYDRLLEDARGSGKPDLVADALLSTARANALAGRDAQAASDVAEAKNVLSSIPEGDVRARLEANLYLSEVGLLGREPEAEKLQSLTTALGIFERTENQFKQAQVLLERGRLLAARRDDDGAQADFDRAILKLEKERADLPSDARVAYFDTGRRLFESMIGLLAAKGDAAASFRYADQAHGRALLDGFESSREAREPFEPLTADQVITRLPDRTALIEYYVCPGSLLAWVITRDGIRMVRTPLSGDSLEGLVGQLEAAATDPKRSDATESVLRQLYGVVIQPIEAQIGAAPHLVIVPDRELHRVPFSALRSPSGRYVVEDHDVTITPSATWFVRMSESARARDDGPPSVLLVAGPGAPTGIAGPPLPRLDGAEEEVAELARIYPGATVLTGANATKKNFLELAPHATIIHFAGHAIANRMRPDLSMLVFASGSVAGYANPLYSHEISRETVESARLVVLAACSTAAGRLSAGEGMLSLAKGILRAGVPTVVASLEPAEDSDARRLLTVFHDNLSEGLPPERALKAAQLSAIHEHLSTRTWTFFQTFGHFGRSKG